MKSAVLLALLMTAILRGTVHDSHDGRPVRNAALTLVLGSDTYTAETDSRGAFIFLGIPSGKALLKLDAPGYSPTSVRLCVHPGEDRTLPLRMRTNGSIPELNAITRYNESVANGLNPNATSDTYYLSTC